MLARVGLFLLKYWKIIALIVLVSGISFTVYKLYEDNKILASQVELAEDRFERCKTIRDDFSDRISQLTSDLQKVEGARQQLENLVDESDDEIRDIRSDRDRLQWELENREVPVACEEKFDYLVERFQFLRGEFYDEGENQ